MTSAEPVLRVGSYVARLIAAGPMAMRLASLLVDLIDESACSPDGVVEVVRSAPDAFAIRSNGRVWNDAVAESDVADEIVHMLLRAALDQEVSLVHIHAGAVVSDGRTAILAGWPGSGKSSAIAAMVSAGFQYVTDERLAVALDGTTVTGFPKPISLIAGSFAAFADLDPIRTGVGEANHSTWQIPASSLGAVATQEFISPTVLVFVAYREDAALRIVDVAPATAVARLAADSPDVGVRGREGVGAIAALASCVRSVEIEYGDVGELTAAVRRLLAAPESVALVAPPVVEGTAGLDRVPPVLPADIDLTATYAVAAQVSAWILDDRSVVHLPRSGHIVELDAVSTLWLQLLEEPAALDELIAEVAAAANSLVAEVELTARTVAHQLWSVGVIGPTSDGPPAA